MKDLSKCEQAVMAEIWRTEEIDMEGVRKRMEEKGTDWAKQTVSTFLRRLVEKGYAKRERSGRYIYYSPIAEKEEYAAKLKKEYEDFCEAAGVNKI